MRVRRWWMGFVAALLLGLLVGLAAQQSPVGKWLIYGAWGVVVIAVVARAMRPGARGHRMRSSVGPDLGPVAYGSGGSPTPELTLDRVEPAPGDLREE